MANIVSLLPGTLSVELDEEFLRIHMLDETVAIDEDLHILEDRLARIFKLELMEVANCKE
jgi:multisubunit Na+/H+ antiporter MnhE subunit